MTPNQQLNQTNQSKIDTTPIKCFDGDYKFLSNFWPAIVLLDDKSFPSVECAYQAAKTEDINQRLKFQSMLPSQAKRAGKYLPLRYNWNDIKRQVMLDLLRQKFDNPDLREKLLSTGNRELIEGNWWGDIYWGVYNGSGENHLGRLLMQVRWEQQRYNPNPNPDSENHS